MKLELIDVDGAYRSFSTLRIKWDDGSQETHNDSGEPEDNMFSRDWDWVPGAIERAYAEGLLAGRDSK